MAKVVFGEYAAFETQGGVRFQQNNKMVSEKAVPPEVVNYLKNKLSSPEQPDAQSMSQVRRQNETAKFPRPTEEQLKAMRAESVQVKPELQLTPEEEAARATTPPNDPTPTEVAAVDDFQQTHEPLNIADFEEKNAAEVIPEGVPGSAQVDPDFMEQTSIYTADIKDIAQALYDRFGIYTIWLNATPQTDEINPLTGEAFTRYHQGIAYQALVKAKSTGFFNKPAELGMERMTEGRIAHENHTAVAPSRATEHSPVNAPAPVSSFEYRTSPAAGQERQTHYISHEPDPVTGEVRAVRREIPQEQQYQSGSSVRQRYDHTEDEIIAEPRFGQQIIRPNW